MTVAVAILAGLCVTMLVVGLYELATTPTRAVARELAEIRDLQPNPFGSVARRRRQSKKQKLSDLIRVLGERVDRGGLDLEGWSRRLVQAGYWNPDAPKIFVGTRVALTAVMVVGGLVTGAVLDLRLMGTLLLAIWFGGLGWLGPTWYVIRRASARRLEIRQSLADALDLLVACVEAGMGLNQAMVRVAEEIRNISSALSEELSMVNLEIRAGTPRSLALRNMGERVGVDDVEKLVSTLIQTERFGTSVGRALRVQSASLRKKRRQRAEEAAAKTTIKLLFPLVIFIFPALFVVVLGPAVIQVIRALTEL